MEIAVKAGQLLLSLSILVVLHELGHFMFAKLFKTRVEKFYLFFDPWFSLLKFKKGDTEYGVGWIPLGGYVKISGMIDESMDKEAMKLPAQPYEFRSKTTWQRLLIMIGGVLVNFILAFVIYAIVLFKWGEEYLPAQNLTNGVMCDSVALKAGLQHGDKIFAVGYNPVDNYRDILSEIVLESAKSIQVRRNGKYVDVRLPDAIIPSLLKTQGFIFPRMPYYIGGFPNDSISSAAWIMGFKRGDKVIKVEQKKIEFYDEYKSEIVKYKGEPATLTVLRGNDTLSIRTLISNEGAMGVYMDADYSKFFTLKHVSYGFFEAIPAGVVKGINTVSSYLKQFKLIFDVKTKAYESLGGFVTIGKIFPSVWDWQSFWELTAFLSIILAVMNILPIPALDGGHVMFLLYEIITGRKPGDKFLEYAQIVGMVILFSLLIYANANDIFKLFK